MSFVDKALYTILRQTLEVFACFLPNIAQPVKLLTHRFHLIGRAGVIILTVDNNRNMEHSGTFRNIPEHPGTSNNYDNYEKICKINFSKIKLNKNKLASARKIKNKTKIQRNKKNENDCNE